MFDSILSWLQDAPPVLYFVLLTSAGLGMPVSEDLLSIWAGSVIASEPAYPAWHYALALYGGVILGDLITFNLGRLTQRGLGKRIQEAVFKDPVKVEKAMARIRKHGDSIGFVQRFSVGARLPLSFLADTPVFHRFGIHCRRLSRCIDHTATAVVCRLSHAWPIRPRSRICRGLRHLCRCICIGGLALFFWSKLRAEETPSSFFRDG